MVSYDSRNQRVPRTASKLETFNDGYNLADEWVKTWNSRPNPPKVYLGDYRIHHGLAGLLLVAAGLWLDHKSVVGIGARLVIDDIEDYEDWFNFTK